MINVCNELPTSQSHQGSKGQLSSTVVLFTDVIIQEVKIIQPRAMCLGALKAEEKQSDNQPTDRATWYICFL